LPDRTMRFYAARSPPQADGDLARLVRMHDRTSGSDDARETAILTPSALMVRSAGYARAS